MNKIIINDIELNEDVYYTTQNFISKMADIDPDFNRGKLEYYKNKMVEDKHYVIVSKHCTLYTITALKDLSDYMTNKRKLGD